MHSPIETANSSKLTRGTIVKLDSGNGDNHSEMSWIHAIVQIHKAGCAVSPQWPAQLETNRETHLKQSQQAYLTKKWQAHQRKAGKCTPRSGTISSPHIRWTSSVHATALKRWMEVNKWSGVNRIPGCRWIKNYYRSDVEIEDIVTSHTTVCQQAEQVRVVTGQRATQKDDRSRREIVCRRRESRTELRVEWHQTNNYNPEWWLHWYQDTLAMDTRYDEEDSDGATSF